MKYAAYGLLAAFLAHGVYGAIPTTEEGWYTPSGGFSAQFGAGTIYYGYDRTTGWQTTTVLVDNENKITVDDDFDFDRNVGLRTAYEALRRALYNAANNKVQDEAIDTIGKNLYDLTSKSGIRITNPNTGQSYTINFGGSLAAASSAASGEIPATSTEKDPLDHLSLGWTSNGKYQLRDWDETSSTPLTPVANAIKKRPADKTAFDDYELVVRNSSFGLDYVPLGTLEIGGVAADEKSITTNEFAGAVASGELSLYGFNAAADESLPYKAVENGGETLEWKMPGEFVDNATLVYSDVGNGRKCYEIKDAHLYAGSHPRHYFGTSSDEFAALGWHELPNATTNRVEGDNITIASSASASDAGLKKFGLFGWNSGWRGDPLFIVNNGGAIDYIPLSIPSNSVCACSNNWYYLVGWIGDSASFDGGQLSLPEESLDLYLRNTLGYIYSTTPDDLHFDNSGDNIQASFTAPENWADDSSLELSESGKYQLKRWGVGGGCNANIYNMLTNTAANCADKAKHEILCRYVDNGETSLHWLSFDTGRLDVDSSGWTGSFSYVDGVIQSGCVMVGRTPLHVAGFAATDGEYRVRVTLGSSAPTAVLEQGSGFTAPSGDTSYIPVFVLSGGRITADYRGSFVVPAWDY